jgi:hypothetical protein
VRGNSLYQQIHVKTQFLSIKFEFLNILGYLWLKRTGFFCLKIKDRPKGLHNFALCILIFAFSFTRYALRIITYEIISKICKTNPISAFNNDIGCRHNFCGIWRLGLDQEFKIAYFTRFIFPDRVFEGIK